MEQPSVTKKETTQEAPSEQIEVVFGNGDKTVYRWKIDHANEMANLEKAQKLQNRIAGIGITAPGNQDNTWTAKSTPHYVKPRNASGNSKKRTEKPVVEDFTQPEPVKETAPKTPQSNWLFTPKNVETWHHDTLVKHLKAAYEKNHDADQFLAYLRMILAIYQCDFLSLDKKVAAGDFYFPIREIYDTNQQWSTQMIEALPEIKFLFTRTEWAILVKQLDAQKRNRSKEKLTKTEDITLTPTAEETSEAAETPESGAQKTADSAQKKRIPKHLRKKLENYRNNQKGGSKNKKNGKKNRGIFF